MDHQDESFDLVLPAKLMDKIFNAAKEENLSIEEMTIRLLNFALLEVSRKHTQGVQLPSDYTNDESSPPHS